MLELTGKDLMLDLLELSRNENKARTRVEEGTFGWTLQVLTGRLRLWEDEEDGQLGEGGGLDWLRGRRSSSYGDEAAVSASMLLGWSTGGVVGTSLRVDDWRGGRLDVWGGRCEWVICLGVRGRVFFFGGYLGLIGRVLFCVFAH